MSDDVKLETIKETQDILGKFIKKPVLTEKLLKKPPFRFLHDICTAAMRETGFFSSFLNEPENLIENIKDRNGKIAFLQKVIATVELTNGIKLTLKPSKVVAGLEPTKTNEFLQALGKALTKQQRKNKKDQALKTKSNRKETKDELAGKKSSNQIENSSLENKIEDNSSKIQKKKGVENYQEISLKEKKTSKLKSHETAVKKAKKVDEEKNSFGKKHREKFIGDSLQIFSDEIVENNKKKAQSIVNTELEKNEALNIVKMKKTTADKKESDFEVLKNASPTEEINGRQKHLLKPISNFAEFEGEAEVKMESNENNEKIENTELEMKGLRKENTPNKHKPIDEQNKINTIALLEKVLVEKKATFSSSPPPPPSSPPPTLGQQSYPKRENTVTSRPRTGIRQMTARPASARPAAPRIREKNDIAVEEEPEKLGFVNVIIDKDIENEPDEDNLIFLENTHDELLDDISNLALPAMTSLVAEEKHGHLVEQILEAQKELENESVVPSVENKIIGSTEIEWDSGYNSKTAIWEIEKLRGNIQTLTRSVNPLGNLLNFFQEDVDSIQKELETWKNKNSSLSIQIANEKSITEQFIEPLKIHLKEIQHSIDEQYEQISVVKANIIRNNKKIQKLLASG